MYLLSLLYHFRYLQEIGYADTIIDVRSAKVRQLLGVQQDESVVNGGGGERPGSKRPSDGQSRRCVPYVTLLS